MNLTTVVALSAMRDPEAALVGEITDGAGFLGDDFAERVERVGPAGGGEVLEDFGAVGQVHERAASAFFLKVAVAEFEEARVLFAAFPAEGFKTPEGTLNLVLVAVVGRNEQRRAGAADAVQAAEGGAAFLAAGDLHQAVEEKERAAVGNVTDGGTFYESGGVGVVEADGGGAALGGERAGLIEKFLGEIEGREVAITGIPEAEGRATGAAAGFEERSREVGEMALDEEALGSPQAHEVGRAGVVDDRDGIVEVVADGGGGYFFRCHVAMNMPLALSSWGQNKTVES